MEHPQPLPSSLGSSFPCSQFGAACLMDGSKTDEGRDGIFTWEDEGSTVTGMGRQCFSCLLPPLHLPWQLGPERGSLFVIDLLMLAVARCVLGLTG